jgi:methylated-DNA-[protein]-cysteine S-methyltransferase
MSFAYASPLGEICLHTDGEFLTGLHFAAIGQTRQPLPPVVEQAAAWLDEYFRGNDPGVRPPLYLKGSAFCQRVWAALDEVPWGMTTTYGAIAKKLGSSPRAGGNALGRNPVLIFVPCHRVLRLDGTLGGFAGGADRKKGLLEREGQMLDNAGQLVYNRE